MCNALKSYLIAHWRGEHTLSVSLWVNTLGLLLLLSLAELFILPRFNTEPSSMVGNVLLSLLVSRLLIFCWQLTGLLRAIEQDFLSNRNILKTRGLQGVSLIIVLFTLIYSLELIQGTVHFKQALKIHAQPGTSKAFELTLDKKQLVIRGDLEIGITQAARTLIKDRPEISSVVLESQGGHVYEGRGLAKLFIENQLDTYVYHQCSSACTTAFIGGRNRWLGTGGKLGFHQYKLDRSQYRPGILPFYDLGAEQQRDQALFLARGVDPEFIKKMFEQSPNNIWFPQTDLLLSANIVHGLVPLQE